MFFWLQLSFNSSDIASLSNCMCDLITNRIKYHGNSKIQNTNSLFTQDYNVTSMRFIILHTYFTFTTTTKWRVDFRSKEKEKEKGNGNVGFSSILGRTFFH